MAEARRISLTEFEEELKALAQNHEAVPRPAPYPFVTPQIISDISETQNTIIENFKGNQFFKFLFFDQYVENGGGSDYYPIVNKFKNYMEDLKPVMNSKIWPVYNELFSVRSFWKSTVSDYSVFETFYNKYKQYILLSGWSTQGGGHAITVYFKKLGTNNNEIYFVNSGAGLEYHGAPAEGKRPLVIKFSNKSDEIVKTVYEISQFFDNNLKNNRDDNLLYFGALFYQSYDYDQDINKLLNETRTYGGLLALPTLDPQGFYIYDRFLTFKLIEVLKSKISIQNSNPQNARIVLPDYFFDHIAEYYLQCNKLEKIGATLYYRCMFAAIAHEPMPTTPQATLHQDASSWLHGTIPTVVTWGEEQLSGSCTFYSSYHFIKAFLMKPNEFVKFIRRVKESEANEHLTKVLKSLTTSEGFVNHKIIPTVINSSLMLLKDEDLSQQIRKDIRFFLHSQIQYFGNSCCTNNNIFGSDPVPYGNRLAGIERTYTDFMKGEKSLPILIGIFKSWPKYWGVMDIWSFLFAFKMAIALFNATAPSIQIPRLEPTSTTNPYYEWFSSQPIFLELEQMYWLSSFSNFGSYFHPHYPKIHESHVDILKNIIVQCFLKMFILPQGMTEIPYSPTIEIREREESIVFKDEHVMGAIYQEYFKTSYCFIKSFSFERMYRMVAKLRGLLVDVNIKLNVPGGELRMGFLQKICKVEMKKNEETNIPSTIKTIKAIKVYDDELLENPETVSLAKIYSLDHWQGTTDKITKFQYCIQLINVQKTDKLPQNIDSIWEYITHITVDANENESSSDFSDKQRLRIRKPPTVVNKELEGRRTINYYLVDKRNDFLMYCMLSINKQSLLAVYKEIPVSVLSTLLYFLYIYDKEFIYTHPELAEAINKDKIYSLLKDDIFGFMLPHLTAREDYTALLDDSIYLNGFLSTNEDVDAIGFRKALSMEETMIPGFTKSINLGNSIIGYTKDDDVRPNVYYYFKGSDYSTPVEVDYIGNAKRTINDKQYSLLDTPLSELLATGYVHEALQQPEAQPEETMSLTKRIKRFFRPRRTSLKRAHSRRNLPVGSFFQHPFVLAVLLKLDAVEQFNIWESDEEYYVELIKYKKSHFLFNKFDSSIFFVDENEEKYTVVTNYNYILGIWLLSSTNIFLLEKNGQNSLLVLLSNRFIDNHFKAFKKMEYWGALPDSTRRFDISKIYRTYQTIIPLHFTGLGLLLDTNKSIRDDIMALYISYHSSDNILALNLLHPYFVNRDGTKEDEKDIYKYTLKQCRLDNPLWGLYENDFRRRNYYLFDRPDAFGALITRTLNDMENLKLIHKACERFQSIKATIGTKNFVPDEHLHEFLTNFRYLCETTPAVCQTEDVIFTPGTYNDFFYSNVLNDILYLSGNSPTPAYLYKKYYLQFYTQMINTKYQQIVTTLESKTKEVLCFDDMCGFVLKMLEPLDKFLLYGFENPRKLEEVLFEIQYGNFLRSSQKALLERMYHESEGIANEILMGQGKTTTLTPMILLHNYYSNNINKFTIVLPSHLVPQSYEIAFTLLPIMETFLISRRNDEEYISLRNSLSNAIQVLSDNALKNVVLKAYKRSENTNVFSETSFFIFDEVDTLLNALKSDLNIPFNGPTTHPEIEFIYEVCFTMINNYVNSTHVALTENATITIQDPRNPAKLLLSIATPNEVTSVLQEKLRTTIVKADKMTYNQNYGFGSIGSKDPETKRWNHAKGLFTAVPYSANRSPINDSEFTDFELFIVLTILSYFYSPVRLLDLEELLILVSKNLFKLKKLYENDKDLKETTMRTFFPEVMAIFEKTTLFRALSLIETNRAVEDELKELARQINTNEKKAYYCYIYIKLIVLKPYTKIYMNQHNISMVDMFQYKVSTKKVSFSGTVNFNMPGKVIQEKLFETTEHVPSGYFNGQIKHIQDDLTVRASIEASFYGFTTREPELFTFTESGSREQDLLLFVTQNINNYQALVDTCGILLNTSVEEVALKIQADAPEKTVLFVNNNDVRQAMLPGGVIKNYKNETYQNVFMFYDHKHCVGTDFKQPFKMRGLVTIGAKNNLTEIAQGIFRLRNINVGHSVDFYCSELLRIAPKNATNTRMTRNTALFQMLKRNDTRSQEASLPASQLQCAKYVHRCAKNSLDSYSEKIYFETIKQEGGLVGGSPAGQPPAQPPTPPPVRTTYITFLQHIENIVQKFNEDLHGLRILTTIGTKDTDSLATNVDVEQNVELDVEENVEVVVNQNQFGHWIDLPAHFINHTPYTIMDYLEISTRFNTSLLLDINVDETTTWKVYLSPTAEEHMVKRNGETPNRWMARWFYLTNSNKPNTLLVLSYTEAVVVLNCWISLDMPQPITMYDMTGTEYVTRTGKKLPRLIKLLFAEMSMNIVTKFRTLIDYCQYNTNNSQLEYYYNRLGFDYDFLNYRCNWNLLDPENVNNWAIIFDLPQIRPLNYSREAQEMATVQSMKFTQALVALYRKKYPTQEAVFANELSRKLAKLPGANKGGTYKKQTARKRRTYKTRSRV